MECSKNYCKYYNQTLWEITNELNISKNQARPLIGNFCSNCGQTGGHRGECKMHCKFCGSDDHNSQTHPSCLYWNAWGIITLLSNDYYVRNQGFSSGYVVN